MKQIFLFLALVASSQLTCFANSFTKPLPVNTVEDFIYKSADFNISIAFPMAFEEAVKEEDVLGKTQKSVEISGIDSSGTYYVSVTKHTIEMSDHLNMAIESLDEFASTLKSDILSQKSFNYKSHEGKEAVLYLEEQDVYIHYRVILIGDNQYQSLVIAKSEKKSKSIDNFFNSFKTLN